MPGAAVSDEARARESELKAFMLARLKSTEKGSKPREPPPKKADQAEADDPDGGGGGFDMFNDDVEDVDREAELDEAAAMDRGDNYDDKEGYYAHRVGDVLAERYKVLGSFGKGVFSTVVRCAVLGAAEGEPAEVAVKVQRNNEMMRRAGEKEIAILERLRNADPENRKHCIRLVGRFDHEDHLCMVFEALHQNLRSAVKQFGHKRGIQIDAVRAYSRQLFTALRHMEKLGIVHADLKPDNIVVNEKYNLLKVCDFGSAVEADDQELTPYMVSRFYRAPEIMMGLHFSCPIDAWAAAVSLFELYTGRIMFMGNSNNSMLKLIQEVKGKMPHKLIRKGIFAELHFDPDYDFLYKERDRVTGREVIRLIKFEQRAIPGHDLRSLLSQGAKLSEAEARKVVMLADFLDKALTLDPAKRLKPAEALKHPFCDLNRK